MRVPICIPLWTPKNRKKKDKVVEDTSRDWWCKKETCGVRNFARVEICFKCGALRPRTGPKLKESRDLKGVKCDGVRFR